MNISLRKFIVVLVFLLCAQAPFASADTIGESRTFFVNEKYDATSRTQLTATLQVISVHAYLYVDDVYWQSLSYEQRLAAKMALQELGNEFDARIYPEEIKLWGKESNPGIDGDTRTVILFQKIHSQAGGYFDTIHGYQKTNDINSNAREMIFVNADVIGSVNLKSFVAHEFQHLISFNQKEKMHNVNEDVWLNEVRSEYSMSLFEYDLPHERSTLLSRVRVFLANPTDSLTEWPNTPTDYAIASLFGQYLVGRYGEGILGETISYKTTGIASLNEYFARHGLAERFQDVFRDWMVAVLMNNVSYDARYGYTRSDLSSFRVTPRVRETVDPTSGLVVSNTLKDWQPMWYEFVMRDINAGLMHAVRLDTTGDSGIPYQISYMITYRDGSLDVEDASLLSGGSHITYLMSPLSSGSSGIEKIVVVATRRYATEKFGTNEVGSSFSIGVSLVDREQAIQELGTSDSVSFNRRADILHDGSPIKRRGSESEIYVIQGKYKRLIVPSVLAFYPSLRDQEALPLSDALFSKYATSNYIRGVGGKKVYAIWPDGTKHWMNMTGEYFIRSGRDFGAVFVVDDAEIALYPSGPNIIR